MRGNSGFVRRITLGISFSLILVSTINCGPARLRRMIRETYANPEIEIFKNDTQSTEKNTCNYNGKEVERASVICDQKPGCLAIQTHGACCPEYQCDCKRDGKHYENGEKIVDPETPCRVCICRGGEINCNSVTCYNRNDCKPKFVVGRCCPEYDNCPPLENVKINFSKDIVDSEEKFSLKSTTLKLEKTDDIPTSTTEIGKIHIPDNPLGIKIKEITKTGEIRITDDRPKIYKPIKSSEMTQIIERRFLSNTTPSNFLFSSTDAVSIEPNDNEQKFYSNENLGNLDPGIDGNIEEQNELEHDYGNTKGDELSGTKNIRQVDNTTNDIKRIEQTISTSEETMLNSDQYGLSSTTTGEYSTESNNLSNNSKEKRDPIVVVVDHSGQTKSIVVVDADGLQKVDEPIEEQDDDIKSHKKTNAIEKVFIVHANSVSTTKGPEFRDETLSDSSSSTVSPKFSSSEMITKNLVFETTYYEPMTREPIDVSVKDIFHNELLYSTKGPFSTEDQAHLINSSERSHSMEEQGFYILDSATDRLSSASHRTYSKELFGTEDPSIATFDTNYYSTSDQIEGSSPHDYSPSQAFSSENTNTSADEPSHHLPDGDDDDVENNQNPAYPLLPDDISLYGTMQNEDHEGGKQLISDKNDLASEKSEPKILLEVLPLRSNNSNTQSKETTLSSEEWLKINKKLTSATSTSEYSSTLGPEPSDSFVSIQNYSTDNMAEGNASIETEHIYNLADKSSSTRTYSEEELVSSTSSSSLSSSAESEEYEPVNQEELNKIYKKQQLVSDTHSSFFFQLAKDFLRYQNNVLNS